VNFMVYANGYVRGEFLTEPIAWSEAESLVAQGCACAEVYLKVGEVSRTSVQYERIPQNLDEWLKRQTKEVK
jgi:hypothetical protein